MRFGVRFQYDHTFFSNPLRLDMTELVQIGELCLEPTFSVEEHNQYCCEISYIISGSGYFCYNGERQRVSAGDIVVSPPSGIHAIYSCENDALSYAYAGFMFIDKGERIRPQTCNFFTEPRQLIIRDSEDIYDSFRKCMDEFYHSASPNRLLIESYLVQIILLTHRMAKTDEVIKKQRPEQKNPGQLIYKIIKYIDHNMTKPITVASIADSLGYSPYYISHAFKLKMHKTLQTYICESKCERAKELIRQNRFSISEISEKLGYINVQSFSRAFKRTCGITPGEYRMSEME